MSIPPRTYWDGAHMLPSPVREGDMTDRSASIVVARRTQTPRSSVRSSASRSRKGNNVAIDLVSLEIRPNCDVERSLQPGNEEEKR